MIDSAGQVVGINVMINGPEVGMAIPAHVVQNFSKKSAGSSERVNRVTPKVCWCNRTNPKEGASHAFLILVTFHNIIDSVR